MKRRKALSLLSASALSASSCKFLANARVSNYSVNDYITSTLGRDFLVSGESTLHKRALAKGLFYGSSVKGHLFDDPTFADAVIRECGVLVPEGALKWGTLRPTAEDFDFSRADAFLDFAQQHGMLLRGHTLVWHKDLPAWLIETVNKSNVEQILQNHIQKTVKHYAGKIHSWDVVNEVISPVNTDSGYLRKSIWRDLLGADFLTMAFHFAAESDPSALLVFNEHKIDHNGNEEDRRRDFLLEILRDLKSKNVPVHALGMQAHLFFHDYLGFDFDKLRAFLASVATLGLKIIITELDVTDKEFPASPDNRDKIVASVYEDYLSCVLEEPAVIGVVTWGLSDRYTWLSERRERSDGLPIRPLPLDSNLERKHAWNAVARAFDNAPSR